MRDRAEASGRGVYFGIREACHDPGDMRKLGLTAGLSGKTVVGQGLGNVGYHVAKFMQESGARLVGLIEYEGAIYNLQGLDVERVMQHRRETKSILGFPGAASTPKNAEGLAWACDILVPAAWENQITAGNVGLRKTKIVAEGANGPVSADANDYLLQKGVLTISDMYLNASGVTVSHFE